MAVAPSVAPISPTTAILLIALYALLYFLPFYLSPKTRPSPTLSRDAPSVISARIRSVLTSCFLACLTTALLLTHFNLSASEILHLMGLYPLALTSTLKALFLTTLLFLGPLFEALIVDSGWREILRLDAWSELWSDPLTNRNLVAGPLTEEVLFRTASIPLMLLSGAGIRTTVFFSPVIFGLAHFHHFYEFRLSYPRVPILAALLRSVFQLGFTTVFGAYATFVYVRTGSLLAVCVVHAFCNAMGLPRLWGKVQRTGDHDMRRGGEDETWVVWTVAYYVLLVGGAAAFWKSIWVLTESENALVPALVFGRHI
ncbi:hypothetical protein DL546_005969 [Coniochaeta pulveracea]|uniref:intramembrane prenyl-peptidase Rce1 n=1 Tax=Coniochaeta pulveracea TaxID=177199 RepID=A0A420YB74_9PEZI|nr:hypothetical protein DL546_005969 [Coniochaeta pulveracea]